MQAGAVTAVADRLQAVVVAAVGENQQKMIHLEHLQPPQFVVEGVHLAVDHCSEIFDLIIYQK